MSLRRSALIGAVVGVTTVIVGYFLYGAIGKGRARTTEATDVMVSVDGHTFQMGSDRGEPDEGPPHAVQVRSFRIDRTEVTVAAYEDCVAKGACAAAHRNFPQCNAGQASRRNHPINCVSFRMAEAYCQWRGKRLPTEAEWEFSARGADGRAFPWGSASEPGRACLARKREARQSCAAGSHPSDVSPFGTLDLAGNVSEWTASNYCNYADAANCESGSHVVRGGSWDTDDIRLARASYRDWVPDERYGYNLGFRCAESR